MLTLKLEQNGYIVANRIMINLLQMLIKSIQIVDMGIKLFVVMMISIPNQCNFIGEKMWCLNLWKKC